MSKGERMRTHTERTEGDDFAFRNSSAEWEMEKAAHCVANLERSGRFTTQRVVIFSSGLETPQKTRAAQFGTRCVPNCEEALPTGIYADEHITEFDQAEVELAAAIQQGMNELEGMLR
jgi:hypothetical protein